MKKTMLIVSLIFLGWTLTSCSSDVSTPVEEAGGLDNPTNNEGSESFGLVGGAAFELPETSQIMLGTFLLQETEFAVDANQAAQLLPLWKAVRTLSTSDSAAPEEIGALQTQIEETMTESQLEMIFSMELTGEDIFGLVEELGLEFGPRGDGSGSGDGFPGGDFQFPEGGIPGGNPGGGRGGGPGVGFGEGFDPEALATARAERAGGANFGDRATLILVDPLIDLLEELVQE